MKKNNPTVIPRNHKVEEALEAANNNDMGLTTKLLSILNKPYDNQNDIENYLSPSRACDEIQGSFVLTMSGRGFESRITTDNDMTFGDSSCVSCGACAHTCPTDAISDVFQSKSAAVDKKVRTTARKECLLLPLRTILKALKI